MHQNEQQSFDGDAVYGQKHISDNILLSDSEHTFPCTKFGFHPRLSMTEIQLTIDRPYNRWHPITFG